MKFLKIKVRLLRQAVLRTYGPSIASVTSNWLGSTFLRCRQNQVGYYVCCLIVLPLVVPTAVDTVGYQIKLWRANHPAMSLVCDTAEDLTCSNLD